MAYRERHELQIAIDGPAGAGKSTVAKLVAKQLNLFYVDTGAMYRAIAYKALTSGIPINDEEKVSQIAQTAQVVLDHSEERLVWCDGQNVTQAIRNPEISRAVATVAAYSKVRERLVELQRREAARGGVVMDGRDIGTHVLPGADLKIFLTASAEERAKRRWIELRNAGKDIPFEEVARDMQRRDRQDTEREVSPLEPAPDAKILDTTGLKVEDIVAEILRLAQEG
ncbi:cytidylate kinase [Desulfosporosinus acidiphilus SJ4]|uniref:Cytidylate kinase n=1 Tax=Desulfosporosinus acidiphilus (strain DSM 22704 / JCM 16185 / SJ4) TaxID=646529 RepID=I4D4T2_DESAJ|nr:(d)CMP kinase [Desulfosporosinus acidiphilus]AFM40806.1 cytidylate kinase [Desulfosporosinus acidiphilus SJ4]